jgi:hypothetical protein
MYKARAATILGTAPIVVTFFCIRRAHVAPKREIFYLHGAGFVALTLLFSEFLSYICGVGGRGYQHKRCLQRCHGISLSRSVAVEMERMPTRRRISGERQFIAVCSRPRRLVQTPSGRKAPWDTLYCSRCNIRCNINSVAPQ